MKTIRILIILITIIIGVVILKGCIQYNVDNIFKKEIEINGIEMIIDIGGVEKYKKGKVISDNPFMILIKRKNEDIIENRVNIKKIKIIEDSIEKEVKIKKSEYYYYSEYIDLKHEDFILKLEYQIKTKDKIIDGKIETKMEYERKIYLTCPLWDAMMGI